MAHLWLDETSGREGAGGWAVMRLDSGAVIAPGSRPQPLSRAEAEGGGSGAALLLRCSTPDGEAWVLVGFPDVRVNGRALDTGIRVLRDRDELRVGGCRTFFSTESLAAVGPFRGGERPAVCPRCRLEIAPQSPAVACPHCGVSHHQSVERECWTYARRCALCGQPTALDTGFRWTPSDL